MASRITLTLAALLVAAGCLGGPPSSDTETTSPTATATPTYASTTPRTTGTTPTPETTELPSETVSYSTDCPLYFGVEPASDRQVEDADRVVAFEDLSDEREREFERALDGDTTLEPGTEDFWIGTVVTYRGRHYAADVYTC